MPADRVLAGEKGLSGGLADECYMSALQALVRCEDTTVQKRNLDCGKVSWLSAAPHQVEAFALWQWRMFYHAHYIVAAPALPRRRGHQSRSPNAGERAHELDKTLHESDLLDGLFVTRLRQAEVHRKHVVRRHAEVSRPQPLIALEKKSSPDQ